MRVLDSGVVCCGVVSRLGIRESVGDEGFRGVDFGVSGVVKCAAGGVQGVVLGEEFVEVVADVVGCGGEGAG